MIEKIVVGTDGSDTAAQAVVQAGELAEKLGAALVIVSAFDPVSNARLDKEREGARATLPMRSSTSPRKSMPI